MRPVLKASTVTSYEQRLRVHILPAFGSFRVRNLDRGRIKALLSDKLASGLAPDSVRLIHATLRALLNSAIEDNLIGSNPARGLGRSLRLTRAKATRQEEIKAFDREQLSRFLGACVAKHPRLYSLFLTMARGGLRVGEALALQWSDLDFERREIRVSRAINNTGELGTPKSGHARTVDMAASVKDELQRHQVVPEARWLKVKEKPFPEMPAWCFPSDAWTPQDHSNVGKAFRKILKAAGLPPHYSPHSLRHSFASQLLQGSVSPAYVQRMLGHASITLTVDTYGRWLPMGNLANVDKLDEGFKLPEVVAVG